MPFRYLSDCLRSLKYIAKGTKKQSDVNGPIFIVGTGRSGTHFLCSCLNLFDNLSDKFDGIESPYIFWDVSNTAVKGQPLSKKHIGYYKWLQQTVYPNIALDQTHPNLWNVESLLDIFPRAKFIAIKRDVRSVIYSMKIHQGVSKWAKSHHKYSKPNKFLGVTESNIYTYETKLTDMQRDVFRWCSHMERIDEIETKFPQSVKVINYADLAADMPLMMKSIAEFIGIDAPKKFREFSTKSLKKNKELTGLELKQIDEALRLFRQLA